MKVIRFPKSPKLKYVNSLIRSVNEVIASRGEAITFDLTETVDLDSLAISFLCGLANLILENNPSVTVQYKANRKIESVIDLLQQALNTNVTEKSNEVKIGNNIFQLRKITSNNSMHIDQILLLLQRELGFGEETKGSLRIVLTELLTNAIDHSGENCCYVCLGRWPNSRHLNLVCLDFGVGIPAKLRTRFPELKTDELAFERQHALGLTTRVARDGGRGYRLIQDILKINKGRLNIISNQAKVNYKYDKGEYKISKSKENFAGTCVDIQFNPSKKGFDSAILSQNIEEFF